MIVSFKSTPLLIRIFSLPHHTKILDPCPGIDMVPPVLSTDKWKATDSLDSYPLVI